MNVQHQRNNNGRSSTFPKLHRDTMKKKLSRNDRSTRQRKLFLMVGMPLLIFIGMGINYLLLNLGELGFGDPGSAGRIGKDSILLIEGPNSSSSSSRSWCDRVRDARDALTLSHLRISYPCEAMKPATSAIVCMLTDGATEAKANRIVFSARDYIDGAMSLGASLQGNIDTSQTHQLLLLREGFELDTDDLIRLESVGWTIGTAPNFPLQQNYIPKFPRYKTTYTKVTAIGLSEYKCVMLMDADTLAVGDLRDVMKCDTVFKHPNNRVGGTLDWYHMGWKLFNTGSILWKTDAKEMERVFNLTEDASFMRRFGSDQDFLNNVYPDRLKNTTLNNEIVALDNAESRLSISISRSSIRSGSSGNKIGYNYFSPVVPHKSAKKGAVVPLSWDYNAQTHAEVQHWEFWKTHRPTTKILHFTEKKGWQCERNTNDPPPPEEMPKKCKREIPICFCREAHLYWRALEKAELASEKALAAAKR